MLNGKGQVCPDTALPTEPKIRTTWPSADSQPEICLNPALTGGEPGGAGSTLAQEALDSVPGVYETGSQHQKRKSLTPSVRDPKLLPGLPGHVTDRADQQVLCLSGAADLLRQRKDPRDPPSSVEREVASVASENTASGGKCRQLRSRHRL